MVATQVYATALYRPGNRDSETAARCGSAGLPLWQLRDWATGSPGFGRRAEQYGLVRATRTPYRAVLQFPVDVTGADWVCLRTMSMAISIDCS